jgi:hypothetical protein
LQPPGVALVYVQEHPLYVAFEGPRLARDFPIEELRGGGRLAKRGHVQRGHVAEQKDRIDRGALGKNARGMPRGEVHGLTTATCPSNRS